MSAEQPLPRSWTETTLDSLLHRIEAGLNVKCEERPPNLGEKGLVKISAVTWGQFDELQSKTLPASETPVPSNRIQPGDLLISRANTIELVGSSVIVKELQRELYLSDKVLRLVVHEPSKRWINYALKTPALRKAIEDGSSGNQLSMRNISQEKLKALPLPLAPEAEQKRIADKLDTVLTRVDAVITRLARVAPLLKRFRQSVLAAATSGRLTEDWRGGRAVNETWRVIPLGKYVENHDGARVPISETLRTERRGAYPYYGASGVIDTIDGFTHEGKFVLIGEDGANLVTRSKPIAFIATGKIWVNNHAHVLKCKEGASDEYLAYYINSIDLTPYVSGSAQPKLNQKNLNTIPVPVPPTEEQTEIVRRVETLFAFADRLEARLAQAQTAATRLTPALLAKAFRGELVPQDPNDEPAAELLRRLQAERATAPKASAGRARKAVVQSEG